jgi:ABC-type multidrug transport system fused ATPase/permease subunit
MSTAFLDLLGVLLIGVVAALSVSVMSQAASPAIVQTIMDRLGLVDLDTASLAIGLAVIAALVLIAKSVINITLTRRVLRFLANRQAMVSGRLAAGLLSRPLLQVQQRSSQETAYALTSGVNYATLIILGQGVVAVTEIALLVTFSVGLLVIDPFLTLFTIAFFLLIALVLQRLLSGWAGRLGLRASNAEVASYASIQEALRTYREVVVAHRRGLYVQRFQDLRWQAATVQSDLQFMGLIPKYVFEVALVIGAGLLAASQLFTKDLNAAVAIIAVFLAAGSRVVPSMMRLQGATMSVRTAAGQAAPTFGLAAELASVEANSVAAETFGSVDPQAIRERLEQGHTDFDSTISVIGAWLTYPDASAPALADVSLVLPAGSSLALVGPTGAGKSTLADVVLGVLHPDRGEVRIGGISATDAISRWPGALAYVPQDVAMANGTVRENVALGLPLAAIDDEWVWEALVRAHLADFLRESREGLDTVIGEHGMKLSGGQRQRLGVARALYTRPKLLVLDEATSALDAETERAIAKTLQELEGTVTTVTIAHRLATIRHCDLVVYLEAGRIVASGSFDEVRRAAPHFDRQAQLLGL